MVERTQQEYLLAQANLVEQARDAAQLAVRRVQEVENRIGDVRGDVRDVRDQTVDARDEVNQRKAEIEAIIGASVPDHEWNGESLRLRNPDGEWGDYTNLKGATGNDGWSPILAIVADGARFVAQVTGWIGGAGTEPATGLYVGPTGYVATAPEAADIRGGIGPIGPAPTLTAGTVTTGAPGSPVEFTVRAVSPGVYEVDVSIPEGLPGLDGGSTAALVEFDNASNGFTADDVQAAIEEVAGRIGGIGTVRFTADGPPAGFVRCDGATYLQSARPALFAKIGKIGSYKTGAARGTGGFNGLAQGGGITVVVGNSTAISSTPDGATWTSRTAPASYAGNLNAITHNGTAFVAAGTVSDSVNIILSVDGVTWTKPTMPGGLSELTRIASSSSIIVAVGSTGGRFIKSEDDGATWDTTGVSGISLMANTNALVHIAALGLFVAIGNTGGTIHTSPDGKVWTKRTPAASFSGGFNAVAYDPAFGIIIVGGSGEIQTSPDGATWTRRMSGLSSAFTSVVVTAGRLVVTGSSGTFSTSDASTWTALASGTLVTNGRFIAVDGGLLYFSTAGNAVISPPPFIDWAPLTPASSYAGNFNLTAMIGNRVVAIGGSTNGIQTFDPVYDLATEFQVPNIPSPAPNVIPYMKAA